MAVIFSHKEQGLSVSHSLTEAPTALPYRLHNYANLEIYCFLRGKGIFHIEGSEYPLAPGDVLIMAPNESHYIELEAQSYERIVVNVSEEYLRKLDPQGWLLTPFFDRPAGKYNRYSADELPGLSCFETMLQPGGTRHVSILVGLLSLLDQMARLHRQRSDLEESRGETVQYSLIRYINRNLHQSLTLDMLCEKFYISKSQLCRLFKKATGTTVWNYITAKRLALAQQLLDSGQAPTHIYTQCGFADYSTFYRAYRSFYGHAPGRP